MSEWIKPYFSQWEMSQGKPWTCSKCETGYNQPLFGRRQARDSQSSLCWMGYHSISWKWLMRREKGQVWPGGSPWGRSGVKIGADTQNGRVGLTRRRRAPWLFHFYSPGSEFKEDQAGCTSKGEKGTKKKGGGEGNLGMPVNRQVSRILAINLFVSSINFYWEEVVILEC